VKAVCKTSSLKVCVNANVLSRNRQTETVAGQLWSMQGSVVLWNFGQWRVHFGGNVLSKWFVI